MLFCDYVIPDSFLNTTGLEMKLGWRQVREWDKKDLTA